MAFSAPKWEIKLEIPFYWYTQFLYLTDSLIHVYSFFFSVRRHHFGGQWGVQNSYEKSRALHFEFAVDYLAYVQL